MNLDNLHKWLTLLANVGVVAGIFFLAFEIRQNEEMLDRQYELAVVDSNSMARSRFTRIRELWLENPELRKIFNAGMSGAELDEFDELQFFSMCVEHIWSNALNYERATVLNNLSMRDTTVTATQETIADAPGFRRCWESHRDRMRDWGFREYVDAVEAKAAD